MAGLLTEPEYVPGDLVMILSPAGPPPWPDGPCTVLHCTHFDENTCDSTYVVMHPNGRVEQVEGIELDSFENWVDWMRRHAN